MIGGQSGDTLLINKSRKSATDERKKNITWLPLFKSILNTTKCNQRPETDFTTGYLADRGACQEPRNMKRKCEPRYDKMARRECAPSKGWSTAASAQLCKIFCVPWVAMDQEMPLWVAMDQEMPLWVAMDQEMPLWVAMDLEMSRWGIAKSLGLFA